MPLPVSHGFLGAAVVAAIHPKIKKIYAIPLLIGGILANIPDLDFLIAFPTHDFSWHRGFTHSILFSLLIFLAILAVLGKERIRESVAYGLAYFSHTLLDYLATKISKGVELFWFFSSERYKLGMVSLSENPQDYSINELIEVLTIELLLFGLLFVFIFYMKKTFDNKNSV